MGAKTWMIVCSDGNQQEILRSKPELDRDRTVAFAKKLFPAEKLEALEDGSLSFTCPPDDELVAGCFPGVSVVAGKEFGIDYPSQLAARFLNANPHRFLYLHAMHSVVDWFAYAVWQGGKLQRSLSLSPDSGLLEDIGERLPFEKPFWAGLRPVSDSDGDDDAYPFVFHPQVVFHPLELGEAALLALFGYQLEGIADPPDDVPLMRFKRSMSWWRRLINSH